MIIRYFFEKSSPDSPGGHEIVIIGWYNMLKRNFCRLRPESGGGWIYAKGRSGLKHPALTRALAAALAVMCLVMLLAGGMGLARAAADKQSGDENMQRLEDRIDEYTQLESRLAGKKTYQQQKETLDRKESAHAENAAEHRRALAEYSATRGGLVMGTQALDKADAALAEGKAQFEAGLREFETQEAAFNEGYAQYQQGVQQLEQMKLLYSATSAMLASAEQELSKVSGIGDLIENSDKAEVLEKGVEQMDSALAAYDQAAGYVNGLAQQGAITQEQLNQFNSAITEAVGMSPEELRAAAQDTRDKMEQDPDEVMSDEEFEQLKNSYAENKDRLEAAAAAAQAQVDNYKVQLAAMKEQMDAAQAEIDKLAPVMEEGRKGIELGRSQMDAVKAQMEQGEKALYDGRVEIWAQLGELKNTQAELEQERRELKENRENLDKDREAADNKNELEQQRTYLRSILLDRDGISRRVDEGMELAGAANEYLSAQRAENLRSFRGRAAAYSLLIIGAIAGFAGIPAAFEKTKKRSLLILPPLVCFVCAAGAEIICLALGRGSSYSAIGAMIFAAIQILLVLPNVKRDAKT